MLFEWILIITFSYTGNSITSQHITFPTQESCMQAGRDSVGLASNVKYVCVKRPIIKK